MYLKTELHIEDVATLIIGDPQMRIIHELASELKSKDVRVLVASHIPPKLPAQIQRVFCFSRLEDLSIDLQKLSGLNNIVFLSSIHEKPSKKSDQIIHFILKHNSHIKIALIPRGEHEISSIIHKLLSFTFDPSEQFIILQALPDPSYLKLPNTKPVTQSVASEKRSEPFHIWVLLHPKKSIMFSLIAIFLIHVLFIVPLTFSLVMFGGQFLIRKSPNFKSASQTFSKYGKSAFYFSRDVYTPVKRGWLFVGLAPTVDKIFDTVNATLDLEIVTKEIQDDAGIMLSRMFDPQSEDSDQIFSRKEAIKSNLDKVRNNLTILEANVPKSILKSNNLDSLITRSKDYLAISDTVLDRFDEIFGKSSPKLYAVFFANNHEIRPGGGFIGSFALVKTHKLKISEWKVYDVYDADGQLKARVKPPEAISTYLRQPFFFLRDSAFSPDFPTNALVAEDFLQKELGISRLDGEVIITFSSIEKILKALGPIYIPEYKTTISYDNAYYKTQLYSEKNSFPGSSQKKDFLEALVSEIILKFSEPREAAKIILSMRDSFDNKNIAAYFKDTKLQQVFEKYQWSGRQLTPNCIPTDVSNQENCVAMYIYPVEANLGVNKANAFIKRSYLINTKISPDGTVEGELITKFSNSSTKGVFPGGTYKNYYQVFLPVGTTVLSVKKESSVVSKYDFENTNYSKLGYFIEVPEGKQVTFSVSFRLNDKLQKSGSTLQIIVQKQIGLPNSDLTLRFGMPTGYTYSSSNFSPLALQDVLEYNSTVDSDKIYYLHF